MKYKVGDRVRICSSSNIVPKHLLNTIQEIKKVSPMLKGYELVEQSGLWYEEFFEGLEEEWKPKEGDIVLARDCGTKWKERTFIMKSKAGTYLCGYQMNDDGSVNSTHVTYWDEIKKAEDKKRERKLMMTDSEWAKFQKDNNL